MLAFLIFNSIDHTIVDHGATIIYVEDICYKKMKVQLVRQSYMITISGTYFILPRGYVVSLQLSMYATLVKVTVIITREPVLLLTYIFTQSLLPIQFGSRWFHWPGLHLLYCLYRLIQPTFLATLGVTSNTFIFCSTVFRRFFLSVCLYRTFSQPTQYEASPDRPSRVLSSRNTTVQKVMRLSRVPGRCFILSIQRHPSSLLEVLCFIVHGLEVEFQGDLSY